MSIGAGAGVGVIGGKSCECIEDVTNTTTIAAGVALAYGSLSNGLDCTGVTVGGATSIFKTISSLFIAGLKCTSQSLGCSQ